MNVIEFILVQGQPQIRKYECILLPVPDMASCVCCQVTDDRVHSLFILVHLYGSVFSETLCKI